MVNISEFIAFLLENDTYFQEYYERLTVFERRKVLKQIIRIDRSYNYELDDLVKLNEIGYIASEKYFHLIPQKEFSYVDNINNSWENFLDNCTKKEEIKSKAQHSLQRFLVDKKLHRKVNFYGGIKPHESIALKANKQRNSENYMMDNKYNIWDIVRFRFVVNDFETLFLVSFSLWEYFYYDILRCRNYYFKPVNYTYNKHFKAVHFIIKVEDVFFELQLITKIKEINSFLDHHILYKEKDTNVSTETKKWLSCLLLKSNIYEFDNSFIFNRVNKNSPISELYKSWRFSINA